eukprot:jgi/Hompol1/1893/HPOL_005774-RA
MSMLATNTALASSLAYNSGNMPPKSAPLSKSFKECVVSVSKLTLENIFGVKGQDPNPIDSLMSVAREYISWRRTPQWSFRDDSLSAVDAQDDMAVRLVDVMPDGPVSGLVYDENTTDGDLDIVISGSRKDLLDGLIFPLYQDMSYAEVFLATYRYFMPASHVLDCLIGWYNADAEEQTHPGSEAFLRKNRKQIQTRAIRVLLAWIRNHWHDFHNDPKLNAEINFFVDYLAKVSFGNNQKLAQAIREQRLTWYTYQYIPMFPVGRSATSEHPKPWIADWETDDFAHNLTMIDHLYFRQLKPDMYLQILQHPANVKGGGFNVPLKIIMEAALWFRTIVGYTATVIAKEDNLKKKTNFIKRHETDYMTNDTSPPVIGSTLFCYFGFTSLAVVLQTCKELNNFNTMFAIIYGLKRPVVLMWTQAWESLPTKYMDLFKELDSLIDPSRGYANYAEEIFAAKPPAVPFILPYIQDICETQKITPVYLDDDPSAPAFPAVPDMITPTADAASALTSNVPTLTANTPTIASEKDRRINFQKYYHMYSIAAELEVFRLASYHGQLKGDRESNMLLVNHMRSYAMFDDKALGEGLLFSSAQAVSEWNETAAGSHGNKAMKRATQLFSNTLAH